VIAAAAEELAPLVGVAGACRAVGVSRATRYRRWARGGRAPDPAGRSRKHAPQPRALTGPERQNVLDTLHCERFADMAVEEVYHTLLDEGVYWCSVATMYRLLRERGESAERRRQATHPARVKPELVAERPNQVWSWDITKLKGPAKWQYYHLYVAIDVFSRYNPAWMVVNRESAQLAEAMFAQALRDQRIKPGQLTIHADNGAAMTSKTLAQLLADLEVDRSHSRPHVSNDNPYSESQFKTLKYRPEFPDRFHTIEQARLFCAEFFDWYNNHHRHRGIGFHTPTSVHNGHADAIDAARAHTLDTAYQAHPERFAHGRPTPPQIPTEAWINKPDTPTQEDTH
jgi:putative transposase